MKYKLIDFPRLREHPFAGSPFNKVLQSGKEVTSWDPAANREVSSPAVVSGFVFVKDDDGDKGWVDKDALEAFKRPEVEKANFVSACIAAEVDVNDDEKTPPWFVSADFLIARALFDTDISNTVDAASGPTLFGPLRVSEDEWKKFLAECPHPDEFSQKGWDDPIEQIWAAAYRMRRDAKAISAELPGHANTAPALPTLLDLFISYLTDSPESAAQIRMARATDGNASVSEILNQALTQHSSQFGETNTPLSFNEALAKIETVLTKHLKKAFELIQQHVPEAVPSSTITAGNGGPLGHLIGKAESDNDYRAFNRGRAGDSPGKFDFSQMTLGEIMQQQSLPRDDPNRFFAVGKYQLIPITMQAAVDALGLSHDQKLTDALQEHLFRNYLISRKRPAIKQYVTKLSGDIEAAQMALAREFASVASPETGLSLYGGQGGNAASVSAAQTAEALQQERSLYEKLLPGKSADEAWNALSSNNGGNAIAAPVGNAIAAPAVRSAASSGHSGLEIENAVKHLEDNAQPASIGMCAKFVRLAIEAGGLRLDDHPVDAKEYGPCLKQADFVELPMTDYQPEKGDVVVIQNYPGGNPSGHIAMYTGRQWISDFRQRDIWAGPGYRANKPPIAVYRP